MTPALDALGPLAVNTYPWIWRFGLRDTLAHLADAGWDAVEVLVNPPHCWPEALPAAERAAIARLCAKRGIGILSLNPPMLDLNLLAAAPEMRRYSIEHYRRVIELASEWGVPYVVVVSGKLHPLLPAPARLVWPWLEAALQELDLLAERSGVRLALENVPAGFLSTAAALEEAIARLGSPRIGACYDVANAVFAREDPVAGLARLAPHLQLLHLSDTGLERWAHAPFGTGVVPLPEIAAAVAALPRRPHAVLEVIAGEDADAAVAASRVTLLQEFWRGGAPNAVRSQP